MDKGPAEQIIFWLYKKVHVWLLPVLLTFQGAWLLLSQIVSFLPKFDTSFILQYWQNDVSCSGIYGYG